MKVINEYLTIRLINAVVSNQLLPFEILSKHSAFVKRHYLLKIHGREMPSKTIFICSSCNISILIIVVDNNNYPGGIYLFKVKGKDTKTTSLWLYSGVFIVNLNRFQIFWCFHIQWMRATVLLT